MLDLTGLDLTQFDRTTRPKKNPRKHFLRASLLPCCNCVVSINQAYGQLPTYLSTNLYILFMPEQGARLYTFIGI